MNRLGAGKDPEGPELANIAKMFVKLVANLVPNYDAKLDPLPKSRQVSIESPRSHTRRHCLCEYYNFNHYFKVSIHHNVQSVYPSQRGLPRDLFPMGLAKKISSCSNDLHSFQTDDQLI
ncbi:hypothetical protein TNCV_1315351 [Trichonephila clavipes]|uniref:Uncharacterized protein n=1 Tax=Trichonephila clavipes TaxID=2585209 RepID=A0A8X6SU56_TRICX|nr:hypothetical protein TNCV_1315351 [Trichonephila clavipes]